MSDYATAVIHDAYGWAISRRGVSHIVRGVAYGATTRTLCGIEYPAPRAVVSRGYPPGGSKVCKICKVCERKREV